MKTKVYKIWIVVEVYDPVEDEYRNTDEEAVFVTEDPNEAYAMHAELTAHAACHEGGPASE